MTVITTRRLACGMPLIVEPMSGVRSVGLSWLLPAGSATDPEDRQGLSTMWSELLLRGCGELDSRAQADALDRLGLSRGTDVSTFHLRLSFTMLGDRLLDALPLITDMVRRPRFDAESIEPTRDLALQAIDALADDPHERAVLAARRWHNPSPLNRTGLGDRAGLAAITREDIVEGWARQARPEPASFGNGGNAILSVAGAINPGRIDEIVATLDRLLRGWEGSPPGLTWGASPTKGTYHHEADESSQVQIVLFHDAPAEPSPDVNLERVVNGVMSGGMSARLFTEVREKRGLCYAVSSAYATERLYGRVIGYVGTTPERAQHSLDVLVSELNRVNGSQGVGGGIEQSEFDRALVGIKAGLVFAEESTSARAAALASDQHKLGRPRSLAEIAAAFDQITLERVNAYLERRRLGAATIVTLGPAELVPPPA
ncbi:MAG: insulinase family protein [Phycisphaeraceae bacterium]|nr:insulinase family protein [Phycisphaeraceae bacterium]